MTRLAYISALLLLGACGSKGALSRTDGVTPPRPAQASTAPTVADMLEPPVQAAPERVDDPVKRSREREDDPFDLPPTR